MIPSSFASVLEVLQGDTVAPFLFIICLDYVLRISVDIHNELGFTLNKSRNRRYPSTHITDADYADDLALFTNNTADAEMLLHALETSANDIGLHINAGKTKFMTYNTLDQTSLKQVTEFTYLGSNIASTERDIEIRISKAWTALDKLRTVWKSTLPDKLKREFFRAVVEPVLVYGATTWTLTKRLERDGTYTQMF